MQRVATAHGIHWQVATDLTQENDVLPPELTSLAFQLQNPTDPQAVTLASMTLRNGDYAIVVLTEVQAGDDSDDELLEQYQRLFSQLLGERDYERYVVELQNSADIDYRTDRFY